MFPIQYTLYQYVRPIDIYKQIRVPGPPVFLFRCKTPHVSRIKILLCEIPHVGRKRGKAKGVECNCN